VAQAVEVPAQRTTRLFLGVGIQLLDRPLRHAHPLGDAGEDAAIEKRHPEPLGHPRAHEAPVRPVEGGERHHRPDRAPRRG